jgi:hypothetical protein
MKAAKKLKTWLLREALSRNNLSGSRAGVSLFSLGVIV